LKTAIPTATDEPDNLDDVHIQIMPSADHNQLTEMASLSGAGDFTGHIQQGFYYPEAKGMTSFEEMPHISPQQAFDSQANFWCMPSDIPIEYRQPGHIFVGHPSRSGNSSDMGNAMYPHEVSAPLSGAVMASGNVSYTPLHDPSSMPPPMNPYSLAAYNAPMQRRQREDFPLMGHLDYSQSVLENEPSYAIIGPQIKREDTDANFSFTTHPAFEARSGASTSSATGPSGDYSYVGEHMYSSSRDDYNNEHAWVSVFPAAMPRI